MSRKKKYRTEPAPEPGLDISSLIDVSFLLLIYFLVTTTLKKKEVDVGMRLPSSIQSEGPPPELPPLVLSLEEDGSVIANPNQSPVDLGKPVNNQLPLLEERLREYKDAADRAGQIARITLKASNNVEHQKLVTVFNEIADVGISDVTLDGFMGEE